jgi:hypothetical protein
MRCLVLVFGLVTALAAPAAAQNQRDITGRILPDRATSTCIGQTTTPVCATETLLACLARGNDALCRRVGTPSVKPPEDAVRTQTEYAIERVSVIRAEDITDDLRDLDWFKPGYTLVELGRRSCPIDRPDCTDETWEEMQVYLRPGGGGFELVTWRGESEPDTAPEVPENFQRRDAPSR